MEENNSKFFFLNPREEFCLALLDHKPPLLFGWKSSSTMKAEIAFPEEILGRIDIWLLQEMIYQGSNSKLGADSGLERELIK